MALSIIKPGLLDTIQDMGRYPFGNWGISPAGAMDRYASQVANVLVGNCQSEAVIETHFPGPQILFEQNALISLTGADFSPMVNDQPVPLWHPVIVRKNTVLHFPKFSGGARCYLSIHGGLHIEKWLNSYSTNLRANAGGVSGRALRKGDCIYPKESSIYFAGLLKEGVSMRVLPWRAKFEPLYEKPNEIFVIHGKEWDQLCNESKCNFLSGLFAILPSSDRMGYKLKGFDMIRLESSEIISSSVSFGTLQLQPDGQMVILMADHQTTGGYPRLAHVISAHLPKLAQLLPGDSVKFQMTELGTAEKMIWMQHQAMKILEQASHNNLHEMVCQA